MKIGILYFTTCFHGFAILRHVDPFVRMLHICCCISPIMLLSIRMFFYFLLSVMNVFLISGIGRQRSLSDHNHVEGLVNQVTRIICPLRGYPDPKFKWLKDGENLNLPQILATTQPPQHNR